MSLLIAMIEYQGVLPDSFCKEKLKCAFVNALALLLNSSSSYCADEEINMIYCLIYF